jgi:Family of unknown function (DUF6064)
MVEKLMAEWWTYTISDFLLFSPRTYYRLLGLYNRSLWPAHVAALAAGMWSLVLLRQNALKASTWIMSIMALAWAWVAWGFHFERYATINWSAVYAAIAFAVEAVLLAGAALSGWLVLSWPRVPLHWLGLALYSFALLFYPLLAVIFGRGWSQSEVFGLAPDPTVLATLSLLLTGTRAALLLVTLPLLWCVISSLTLYAMGAPEAWIMSAATALVVFAMGFRMALNSD